MSFAGLFGHFWSGKTTELRQSFASVLAFLEFSGPFDLFYISDHLDLYINLPNPQQPLIAHADLQTLVSLNFWLTKAIFIHIFGPFYKSWWGWRM